MAQIQIYGDTNKGCIFFDNSSVEPKFLGTIVASIKANETNRIVVQRTDRYMADGVTFRKLFKRLLATRVQDQDGHDLVADLGYTVQEVVDYINTEASSYSAGGAVRPTLDEHPNFALDDTSTSIMVDNGESFGVNTIKAILGADGLIDIVSGDHSNNSLTIYEDCPHANLQINGLAITGGANDVVNKLNELFTVGAFEQVVISDPYATMVADVAGVDAGYTLEGADAVDPIGDDIFTYDGAGYANYAGLKSTATIDQKGEYYTFDIRGEGTIGFGLVHTDASFDAGLASGNQNYADPDSFAAVNSAHYGYQFSHWFHPTPNGSWTNYGAATGYAGGAGWSNNWDQQQDWLDGNPVKIRCGIDENGYIAISSLQNDGSWILHARSNYPVAEGTSFHLGVKSQSTSARVYSAPKVHLLAPAAPTMYFRYIESGDGNFEYPLFATAEEAEYYHKITASVETGVSHTHVYADDPTNTTWYMPDNGQMAGVGAPYNMVFDGQTVLFTEITSLTDSDLTPTAFSGSGITQEEGTAVNIQVTPAGASWSSSVVISPAGSGLVYDGYSLVQGTLTDVGSDTTYTITVTRANAYGSSVGSMTVTATDVAPVQTNDTPWTKALDFSGSNEHTKQVSNLSRTNAIRMGGTSWTAAAPTTTGYTSNDTNARPWATAIVFKIDGNNSSQHIWNSGEGAGTGDDNIYLSTNAAGQLNFGWGREGSGFNVCTFATGVSSNNWYGVYIAHDGRRMSASDATNTNLANAFDIRIMSSSDSFNAVGSNLSTSSNWVSTGARMDRGVGGDFTLGGRGSNRSFHGKIASMVVTTIRRNQPMPDATECEMMITDPESWVDDYRVGDLYRGADNNGDTGNFQKNHFLAYQSTQVWLMGDGTNDSYANGVRNNVYSIDQNYTKMQLNSMVSNDIQTVNISGLT